MGCKMNNIMLFPSMVQKALAGALEIVEWLRERNVKVSLPEDTAALMGRTELSAPPDILKREAELIISLGGDGTFLRAARFVTGTEIPIIGINLGSLGFLTEIAWNRWQSAIELVTAGQYVLEERMLLACEVRKNDKKIFAGTALNDVVIHRGAVTRVLHLTISIEGRYVGTYASDGLIVSTPTGSTAYSLSAGGPIVNPEMRCLILTAICPHTLSARPLIITENEVVTISEPLLGGISLIVDGHIHFVLEKNDEVCVAKSTQGIKFLHLERNFYGIVREKLKWISPHE